MNNDTQNTQDPSDFAQTVIDSINAVLENSPTGVSFSSITGYENKQGERANLLINLGVSYEKQVQKDILTLQNLDILDVDSIEDKILGERAKQQLIASFQNPDANRSRGQINAYTVLEHCPSIKVHNETGKVYIKGSIVSKKVIVEGTYPTVNSRPLTIAKNKLRKEFCSTAKYRQYMVESIGNMGVKGETIDFAPVNLIN